MIRLPYLLFGIPVLGCFSGGPIYISTVERPVPNKTIIGRRDFVDLPSLDLMNIDAKVDTGAYTSALHVKKIRPMEKNGALWVKFKLDHPNHPAFNNKEFTLPVFAHKNIRNSSGQIEKRYIIHTEVVLFGKGYLADFSLTDRSKMECPVLLGRKLLYRKFVVDVSQKNLSFKQKQKKKAKE